ncbi:MAG: hypothetical protein E6K52_03805 [Gammaproteobacteria bacterium]|nr:MAG: hypothetical protein E6K52_03805 [Gammaproteobacteria bacterium]
MKSAGSLREKAIELHMALEQSPADNSFDLIGTIPLIAAARRFGIPTHVSEGPGQGSSGRQVWTCWPRSRMEIAHDALAQVIHCDCEAGVTSAGRANVWRAFTSGWSYEGDFVDAVAALALHVAELRPPPRAAEP